MTREIEKLVQHMNARRTEREEYYRREKDNAQRDIDIFQAPHQTMTEYWCDLCQKDCGGKGIKVIAEDWSVPGTRLAYYRGVCPKGHRVIRRITDKSQDPYFIKSTKLKRQRAIQAKDVLQYGEYGFKMLYGDLPQKQ